MPAAEQAPAEARGAGAGRAPSERRRAGATPRQTGIGRELPEPPAGPARPSRAGDRAELAPGAAPATDLESMRAVWPAVVDVVRAGNGLLGALIADARPVAVDGEDLTVAFASTAAFLKKKAEHPDNRAIVTEALRQVTGGRWRLSYELLEADAEAASEQAGADGGGVGAALHGGVRRRGAVRRSGTGRETVQGGHTSENSEPKEA